MGPIGPIKKRKENEIVKSSGWKSFNYVVYVRALKMIRNERIFICNTSLLHEFSLGQKMFFS